MRRDDDDDARDATIDRLIGRAREFWIAWMSIDECGESRAKKMEGRARCETCAWDDDD